MQQPYPAHITDPLRLSIAISYLQHEERKLKPKIRDRKTWAAIDQAIRELPANLIHDDLIRDFWNYFHGVAGGWKLKSNLILTLTSANVVWSEDVIPLTLIRFGGIDGFPKEAVGKTAADAQDWILQAQRGEELREAIRYNNKQRDNTAPRDHFSLILRERDGLFDPLDASGRIVRAIVQQKESVQAFVGQPMRRPLYKDHWVPTSTLMDLVMAHRDAGSPTVTAAYAAVIADMIRNTVVGRREFAHRAVVRSNRSDCNLLEIVARLMPEHAEEFQQN